MDLDRMLLQEGAREIEFCSAAWLNGGKRGNMCR